MSMQVGEQSIKPTKIICLGRNYLDHIKETAAQTPEEPVFFAKTLNTLVSNNKPIIYPRILFESQAFKRVDHEIELAFLIKKECKDIAPNEAFDFIKGYTVFLDITAREMQIKDRDNKLPWYRSKNFDTFAPIGPQIVSPELIGDPHSLNLKLTLNGEIKQNSNTRHMLFKIPEILAYISKYVSLELDDIIATGTPSGISPIKPGDVIEASIEKIGTIRHQVKLE
jgi:2-keto-4-pentenoate hydratase/2-oxohepta-3-ene-1,7-dioic acid hydratase in catechol pathway